MDYMETREVMCDICHKMWQLGWVAANDGNLSVKLPDGNFRFVRLNSGSVREMWKLTLQTFAEPLYNHVKCGKINIR